MATTRVRPQNLNLKVNSGTELVPSFVGMLHLDSSNILRVDSVGAGDINDFVTVLPQHTVTGEHGPKVSITQTADDNALAITKGGLTPAAQIVVTGATGGKGLSITSASNTQQSLEIQHNGNADAVRIDVNGTGRALVTEDGDVLFDDGDVAITNGEFRVNTDRFFVSNLRIGVGTTSPDRLFDVNGPAAFRGNHIYLTNPSAPTNKEAWGLVVNGISGILSIGPTSDVLPAGGSLTASIIQIDHDAPSNTIFIDPQGQTGFGTAAPGAKVEIETAGNEQGLFVDKNAGSGEALRVDNNGTSFGLRVRNSTPEEAVFIEQLNTSSDDAVQINNSGSEDGIFVQNLSNTVHSAVDARSIGSGPVIHIHSSGSGRDIEGTNANWFFDRDGNLTANNVFTKVASGIAAGSDTYTINFNAGTSTGGTYTGDTGFTNTPQVVIGAVDSGRHSSTDHHRWTLTITSLTSSSMTVAAGRDDVETFLAFRWMAIGT